ncbi:MAG: PAS domain-containing protein [Chloroflexota bacterium]|nr:PAS domain-containing protein [Chloroflexota bacterium]
MVITPVSTEEASRLSILRSLDFIDIIPEERFERLTRLATRHFSVPLALVSLIEVKRQRFKSSQRLDLNDLKCATALCAYTIFDEETLAFPDLQEDPRLVNNPLVKHSHIRFFAGHPIHGLDGSRIATFCIMDWQPRQLSEAEITDLKDFALLVEQELHKSTPTQKKLPTNNHNEEEFKALLESATDIIARFDREGRYLYVNQAIEKLIGLPPAQLIGKTPHEGTGVPTSVDQRWKNRVAQVFEVGQESVFDLKYSTSNNIAKSYHIRLIPEFAKDGTVESVFAIRRDLVDVRQLEAALWASQAQVTDLRESITDAFLVLNYQGEFTYVNREAAGIIEREADELLGKKIWEEFPEAKELTLYQNYRQARPYHLTAHSEEFLASSGRWFEVHTHPSSEGVLVYFRDISQRKQLEEALHRNEEQLRQALKMEAVGRLAGGIAHDFNNLLTVITSYSDLILDGLNEYDPLFLDLTEIKDAAVRATGLTRQLLAFSRRQVLQTRVLDLNEVLSEMKKLLRRLIGENIELITTPAPRLGRIKSDSGQIEQVIVNLAINARDAMPNGGTLLLETANVRIVQEYSTQHPEVPLGNYVVLSVSDNGCGMDETICSHLFEPFFTTKEPGRGTGLGLSTVYGIVKRSGGYIEVSSKVNQGTCFKVYLPQVEEFEDIFKPGVTLTNNLPSGSETILLVEDDEAVRALASKVLHKCGYNVLEAQNGDEAQLLCKRYRGNIHLLLTDIVMPRMNGQEVALQLAPLQPQMKVLYISGYNNQTIVDQTLLEENGTFLQKPFTPLELTRKVREVITSIVQATTT